MQSSTKRILIRAAFYGLIGLAFGLVISMIGGCNQGEKRTRFYPMLELEHRRSHTLETRAGVYIDTPTHDVDVYWAPILGVTDHFDEKVTLDYPLSFGVRWRMKSRRHGE